MAPATLPGCFMPPILVPLAASQSVANYLERRDPSFAEKMAEVLCVYRKVQLLKKDALANKKPREPAMLIISYDENLGVPGHGDDGLIRANTGPHTTCARDHEYKRHGTVTLLAGIDLLTGKVHALVKDRHRSRESIEFLKLLDAAYPADTAIHLILDNHSAHVSRETRAWLAEQTRRQI